jgi:hypothetical protein
LVGTGTARQPRNGIPDRSAVLDYSRALSALIDPVSAVPAMSWQGIRRRLMRNWRAEAVARKRGLNSADADAAKAA